jgi:integrase
MLIPTTEEVGRLLQASDEEFTVFIAVCAFAGLRLGEAAALMASDINFVGRTLMVERQVQRLNGGEVDVRPPKYGSVRKVPLCDDLVELLGHLVGVRGLGPDSREYLFTGTDGKPPHQNTIGHRWRSTARAAGVSGTKLHDLRHYYASGLIHAGCDVVTVQHALGHSKPTTTLNTYAHLWPKAEDTTRSAAAGMLCEALAWYSLSEDGLPALA